MTKKASTEGRPSFELLMQAQEILGQAREVEKVAGHLGVGDLLNAMVVNLFQVALSTEIDEVADAALRRRMQSLGEAVIRDGR